MADEADRAAESSDLFLETSLAAARRPVTAGVPGECVECGEEMPRLVGGLCGYCRDEAEKNARLGRIARG